jgi:uncharacterized protein
MATSWIQMYSGGKFFPLDPKPEDVKIDDIAHALSNVCRFAGQVKRHHSVAIHSVNVSCLLENIHGKEATDLCLLGLLHDAPEAYFGDIPQPVKKAIPDFEAIEDRLMSAVATALMPGIDLEPLWKYVHEADIANLCAEAHELFDEVHDNWTESYLKLIPENVRMPWHWLQLGLHQYEAERRFIQRYKELKARYGPK